MQGIAGLALPGGVAAGHRAPARRAHRRPRVVGDPLPGGAGRPRAGRRARARHPRRDRRRHLHRARRAARCCGGPARPRRCRRSPPEHDIDLAQSYAYSNGDEDVPFLRTVGRPRALNPEPGLAAAARDDAAGRSRGSGRAAGPGAGEVARTVGRRRRHARRLRHRARRSARSAAPAATAVDLGIALGGELGTALAGVRLDVARRRAPGAARPAVFLFNHQSQLDVLVARRSCCAAASPGVAKKEAGATTRLRR